MTATLDKAFGYHGDTQNLPVADIASALPFYETVLGFRMESRSEAPPHRRARLVRDAVSIGLAENGGDPTQDGCAFHVTGLEALLNEFKASGYQTKTSGFSTERHGGTMWNVFYVTAPDGLCYWFGERHVDGA